MEGFSNFHIVKNYSLTLRWVDVFYSASNHIRLRWVYVMRRGPLPSSLRNLWKIMAANTSRMTKEEEGHVVRIPRSVVVEIWKIFESHILSTLDLINPEKAFHSIQNLPTSPATRVNWWWWWEWNGMDVCEWDWDCCRGLMAVVRSWSESESHKSHHIKWDDVWSERMRDVHTNTKNEWKRRERNSIFQNDT